MIIEKAVIDDLEEIMKFYDMMCIELGKADFLPSGNKGGFPSEEMLKDSIFSENLFVGRENGIIMAAYIMNNISDPAYKNINWQTDAPDSKVSILHALRVSPLYAGRGYASALLKHAAETASARGQKAIRLDCIEGNTVPHKMYASNGFKYMGSADIYYEDIGVPRKFLMFEKLL